MQNRVRDLREAKDLNQTQMADACGVSRQTIHAVEKGIFTPSVLLAIKIARVLALPVEKIFTLERGD